MGGKRWLFTVKSYSNCARSVDENKPLDHWTMNVSDIPMDVYLRSCSGFGTPNPTNLGVWVMRWLLCVWATLCSNQPKMLAQPWGWSLLDRHYQWCPSTMSTSASQNRFHKTIVYTGWWFQTWLWFSISYGMTSFPLTFIFFKMVIAPPTSIELATRQ